MVRWRYGLLLGALLPAGCWSSGAAVVVYTAEDEEFAAPILGDLAVRAHIQVDAKYDPESTKTVSLTQAILAEGARPRCDVFWNNEILNTLRLDKQGLLEAYRPPETGDFPAAFRSPEDHWHGFAARARVLVVDPRKLSKAEWPTSVRDLASARWRGRCGMAKPLFGTMATHAACLFAVLGDEQAKKLFRQMKTNQVEILSGNRQVALAVAAGQLDIGLTDTDDAVLLRDRGEPLEIIYPDQGEGGLGTLFIPNTVAIIRGGPHPEQARRLVDLLLSLRVELTLAKGPSAQIPLNTKVVAKKARVQTPQTVRPMSVDFQAAADKWRDAAEFLRDEFTD